MTNYSNTSQFHFSPTEHPKFIELVVKLLSTNTLNYYAVFSTYMNYYESTELPTCGVNITKKGMNFYWNRKFVDSLTEKEALFLLLHEEFHLLFDHQKRSIFYNKGLSNVVQDMIINQIIYDEIMNTTSKDPKAIYVKNHLIEIPKVKEQFILDENNNPKLDKNNKPIPNPYYGQNNGLFVPKEYKGELIFELLYEWLREKQEEHRQKKKQNGGGSGKNNQSGSKQQSQGNKGGNQEAQDGGNGSGSESDGDGNGESSGQNPSGKSPNGYGKNGRNGVECQSLESVLEGLEKGESMTIDSHLDDDVSEEARKTIVGDAMQRLKNRGLVAGDVEQILNKLRKSKHDYLKEIKRAIASDIMGTTKKKSITRPHRREIEGLKGYKKYKNVINCILDTSGSMGGDFEAVLSYIFQNDIQVNLIQIDTEVKCVEKIKNKKELERMKIHGLGGTTLSPAVKYVADPVNKLHKFRTVILTDGYTDTLDFSDTKQKTLILSTGTNAPVHDPRGLSKCILIDRENSLRD